MTTWVMYTLLQFYNSYISWVTYCPWIFGAYLESMGIKQDKWKGVGWGVTGCQSTAKHHRLWVTPRGNLEQQFSVISSGSERSPPRHGHDHREAVGRSVEMRRTNISLSPTKDNPTQLHECYWMLLLNVGLVNFQRNASFIFEVFNVVVLSVLSAVWPFYSLWDCRRWW